MILEKRRLEGGHGLLVVGGVVRLGESAKFFSDALEEELRTGTGHVFIDLAGVDIMDSTGIGELVGYLGRFRDRERKLILIRPAERIRKLLDIARLGPLFPVYESLEEALAAEGPSS